MRSTTPSACSTARTCGLTPGQPQRDAVGLGELVDLGQLGRALGVDEVDALEIEHERAGAIAVLGQRADAILERLGGGEEEAAVEAQDGDAGERLVTRVLVEVAEDLRPGLAAEQGHRRSRRDVDEPDERQDDPDHDTGQNAGREHADDRRHRDPEVEARHPVEAPQLGDVDHAEHDGVDDHGPEHGLGKLREQRGEDDQGREHEPAGGERGDLRARARGLVQRAGREARRDRHPLEQPRADVGHPLGRPTPG